MKKIYLIILMSFISKIGISQEINFDIHKTSLSEYLKSELQLKSEKIPTTSNHISFNGEAQPLKYKRKQKNIPDLIIYYFFKEKDSTMSYVLYEWDCRNFNDKSNNPQNKKSLKSLIKKYKSLEKKINGKFGVGKVEGNLDKFNDINTSKGLKQNNTWKPNDSTEIEMYTSISNFYEKRGAVTTPTVHRIRLYIRNKSTKEKVTPKLNDNKIKELDLIAKSFLKALANNDIAKSKTFFSKVIINQVNDKIMNEIINSFDLKKELELIYSGIQMTMTGKSYAMLNYKYSDDKGNPPMTMIKFVFDEDDKIIGFRPMTRKGKINK